MSNKRKRRDLPRRRRESDWIHFQITDPMAAVQFLVPEPADQDEEDQQRMAACLIMHGMGMPDDAMTVDEFITSVRDLSARGLLNIEAMRTVRRMLEGGEHW